MKTGKNQRILIGILLILLSVFCYSVHYLIFHDAHHIFIYLVGDIAFVFIEVLMVSLIIHQILSEREKQAVLKKLNMVIGAFFTRMGTELLSALSDFDIEKQEVSDHLLVDRNCTDKHFAQLKKTMTDHGYRMDVSRSDMESLKQHLVKNNDFVLRLLENQNLLEHENFTELLWAVSHLTEELSHRERLENLSETDRDHLAGDMRRAYKALMLEWITYMEHLKDEYPYLFSLAVRTNPFDSNASVEVV